MATRPKGPRRRPGREPQEPDDVFVAKVFELSTWARHHSQALILGGVALVIALAGALYYVTYRGTLNEQAVAELEIVQQAVALGDVDPAKAQLLLFLERFGSTPYAGEARILLAELYLRSDETQQAIDLLEPVGGSLSDPLGPQLGSMLAKAYEEADRLEDAERQYMRVGERAEMEFQRHEALADAARIRGRLGNHAGAAELYEEILGDLDAADPSRGLYEMRRTEALHQSRS